MPGLILISVLAFTCTSFCTRGFQITCVRAAERLPLYQSLYCIIAALCFFLTGSCALPALETCLYGVAFGVLFWLASTMTAKGYVLGSMALTSVITNMSLILPMLYSILLLSEPLSSLHLVGFALFLLSVLLSAHAQPSRQRGVNWRWLAVVLLSFAANGSTAIIQKIYALKSAAGQNATFLAVAYTVAALQFALCFGQRQARLRHMPEEQISPSLPQRQIYLPEWAKLILCATAAGVGSFGGNLLLGYLSTRVIGAILYPCINGGLAICTALGSFLIFREKPNRWKVLSILFGCAAILVLNII